MAARVTARVRAAFRGFRWTRLEPPALWLTAIGGALAVAFRLPASVADVLLLAFAVLTWRLRRAPGAWTFCLVVAALTIVAVEGIAIWDAISGGTDLESEPAYGVIAAAFLAFAYVVWRAARSEGDGLVAFAIALATMGLVEVAAPNDLSRALGDGFVSCAVVVVIVTLAVEAFASRGRVEALAEPGRLRAVQTLVINAVGSDRLRRASLLIAAALGLIALLFALSSPRTASGWKMVGVRHGAAVWNAALLSTPLRADGLALRDDRIVAAGTVSPRVGVPDAPLLTGLKRILIGAWDGVRVVNVLALLDLWACLGAAVWFFWSLTRSRGGAIAAVVLAFATIPLTAQVQFAAPFDLWPALALAALVMRRPRRWAPLAAVCLALLNVASGYEFALLALGGAVAGSVRRRDALELAVCGREELVH